MPLANGALKPFLSYLSNSEVAQSSSEPASPSIDACLTMAACGGVSRLSVSEQDSTGESERVNI